MTAPGVAEVFETFDAIGRPTGLAPRDEVHATGRWHRSVHVFLFGPGGVLWIQQRAARKDLFPGRWDLSVGEHLLPGENYRAAALRGLREELGVDRPLLRPLGAVGHYRYDLPELGIADHELQRAFAGDWGGVLNPDPAEVASVRAVSAATLGRWIAHAPGDFTPWFLDALRSHPELGAFWLPGLEPDLNPRNDTA